jgi:hypothetical protein
MKELKNNGLRGQIQIYPYCFNLDIIGSGSATPEGVNFPGAYKPTDPSFMFQPFMTYGNDTTGGTEFNSKFVSYFPQYYNEHCVSNDLFHFFRFHQDLPFTRANTMLLLAHDQSSRKPVHILQILRLPTRI